MKFERLGNIAEIQIGKTPQRGVAEFWGKGYLWVSIADLKKKIINETKEEITEKAVLECGCKLIPKGTLLLSFKLSIGKLAFAGKDLFTNEAICGLTIKDKLKVYPEYLYYALKLTKLKGSNIAVKGATLNTASLKAIKIPLPSLNQQIHIANILTKAESLIQQRKQSIALLDEFLKSTFLEMFGDLVRNERGWEINSFLNFGDFKNGLNYTNNEIGVEYKYLGVGDFKSNWILTDINLLKTINLKSAPTKEFFLKNGDLVFVRSNGNKELVGRCLVVYPNKENVTFSGFCIRYRIKSSKINPVYIVHIFRNQNFKQRMLNDGRGANIQNINQEMLSNLNIPVPPIELQNQFAHIVAKTETLKQQYQESLQQLEQLFGSLSQQAFKGELVKNYDVFQEESMLIAAEEAVEYIKN